VAEEDYEAIMGAGSGIVKAGGGGDDGDDGDDMSVVDGATPTRVKRAPPEPRVTYDRAVKSAKAEGKAAEADIKVKNEPKVKSEREPKVGDKRKPGGQHGPRGPYAKDGKAPKVLKGAAAPTINLVSPDKGTLPHARTSHAL
jgi:hypothetical protein